MELSFLLINHRVLDFLLKDLNSKEILYLTSTCKVLFALRKKEDTWNQYYRDYHNKPKFQGLSDIDKEKLFSHVYAKCDDIDWVPEGKEDELDLIVGPTIALSSQMPQECDIDHDHPSDEGNTDEEEDDNYQIFHPSKIRYLCPDCGSFDVNKCGHLPSYMALIMNRCPPPCTGEYRLFIDITPKADPPKEEEHIFYTCCYVFKKGSRQGSLCGIKCAPGEILCVTHSKSAQPPTLPIPRKYELGPWLPCNGHSFSKCPICIHYGHIMLTKLDKGGQLLFADETHQYCEDNYGVIIYKASLQSEFQPELVGISHPANIWDRTVYRPTSEQMAEFDIMKHYLALPPPRHTGIPSIPGISLPSVGPYPGFVPIPPPVNCNNAIVPEMNIGGGIIQCLGNKRDIFSPWKQCNNLTEVDHKYCPECSSVRAQDNIKRGISSNDIMCIELSSSDNLMILIDRDRSNVIASQDDDIFLIGIKSITPNPHYSKEIFNVLQLKLNMLFHCWA